MRRHRTDKWAERTLPALAGLILSVGLFFQGFDNPLGQSLSCLLQGGLLLGLLMIPAERPFPWERAAPALALFAGALAWLLLVASVRWMFVDTLDPLPIARDLFLPKFLSIVAGLWALLIGVHFGGRHPYCDRVLDWVLLFVAAHLALGLLPLVHPIGSWDAGMMLVRGRFAGLTGNSNVTATICGASAVLALSRWMALRAGAMAPLRPADWRYNALYGLCLLLCLAGLVLAASRFPAIITGAAIAGLIFWQLLVEQGRSLGSARFLLLFAIVLLIAPVLFSEQLMSRLGDLGYDGYARSQYWSEFATLVSYLPFTGYGPGSFSSAHAYFLKDVAGLPLSWPINSAHSLVLQLLITGGIPYLLLILAGALLIMRQFAADWQRATPDSINMGYMLAFWLIAGCGMVDIPLDVPASVTIACFIAGMGWGGVLSRAELREHYEH